MAVGDVRAGERWGVNQRFKNALIRLTIRLVLPLVDRLPESWLPRLGRRLGWIVYRIAGKTVTHARSQIALALPDSCPDTLARACFLTAGQNLGRCLLLRRPKIRALSSVALNPELRRTLDAALSERRGCIVVSLHLGPFEYIPCALVEAGYSPAVVVRESYDPMLNAIVNRHRHERGVTVIHRGGPGSTLSIVRALRRGHPVGLLPDLPGRSATVNVEMLGAVAPMARGPEVVALRTRSPVVVLWLEPTVSGSTSSCLGRPTFRLIGTRLCPDSSNESVSQQIATILSEAVRWTPEHWLWMGTNFQVFSTFAERTLTERGCSWEPLDQRELT